MMIGLKEYLTIDEVLARWQSLAPTINQADLYRYLIKKDATVYLHEPNTYLLPLNTDLVTRIGNYLETIITEYNAGNLTQQAVDQHTDAIKEAFKYSITSVNEPVAVNLSSGRRSEAKTDFFSRPLTAPNAFHLKFLTTTGGQTFVQVTFEHELSEANVMLSWLEKQFDKVAGSLSGYTAILSLPESESLTGESTSDENMTASVFRAWFMGGYMPNHFALTLDEKPGMKPFSVETISSTMLVRVRDVEAYEQEDMKDLIDEKQAIESANAQHDNPGALPLHMPRYLDLVLTASHKFWNNADRTAKDTWPENDHIAAWLVEQGMTPTLADKVPTIIRPDWAPRGGRKPNKE